MIIILPKPTLSPTGHVWRYAVLSGLLCFSFSGHAFEDSQNVAVRHSVPQDSNLAEKLPVEPELPEVLHAKERLQPILYQPMSQHAIDMPVLRDWKQSNHRVKELGGWMFYASEGTANDHQPQLQPVKTMPVKELP